MQRAMSFFINFGGNRNPPTTLCRKGATEEDDDCTVRYDMHKS